MTPYLIELRNAIENPNYIKNLVKNLLLNNQHRVRLNLIPSNTLSKEKEATEKNKLHAIQAALTPETSQAILDQTQTLNDRQNQKDDPNILPKVTPKDIPTYQALHVSQDLASDLRGSFYSENTNGIVYQTFMATLPELSDQELSYLPLYTTLLNKLGAGTDDYQRLRLKQSQYTGGMHSVTFWQSYIENLQNFYADFSLSGKALNRHQKQLTELMIQVLFETYFDEKARIQHLIQQFKASSERQITQNGHALAMIAAASEMSPIASMMHQSQGLTSILTLRNWLKIFQTNPNTVITHLGSIQKKFLSQPFESLVIGDEAKKEIFCQNIAKFSKRLQSTTQHTHVSLHPRREAVQQVWTTTTPVNFCAKVYPTIPNAHPDAPILSVLGAFLKNGFLHTAIREKGGAYGGGATHNSDTGTFRFYSYRDPRHLDTLSDFDRSLDWLQSNQHTQASLDEAILSVISCMDKPSSPAGEARKAYYQHRYGRNNHYRKNYREQLLQTTLSDLQRVADHYLDPNHAALAIITNTEQLPALRDLDLTHYPL